MGINEITKAQHRAAEIMTRYGMSKEDMAELMHIAVGAGIEICLQEQESIREGNAAVIAKVLIH